MLSADRSGTELIKVMTGIRRCGKSVMLELIHPQELQDKHYFRKHGQMHITDRINRISRGYKTDEDENRTYGVEQLGLLWSGCYRRYRTKER